MKIHLLWIGLALSAATYVLSAFTNPAPLAANWELLGSRKVNYKLDRDVISVTKKEGTFTALKIKVRKGGINLHRMTVQFGNGETQELEVRENIREGGETRAIDLPGNTRIIEKVTFWYDTKNRSDRRAVVDLLGKSQD